MRSDYAIEKLIIGISIYGIGNFLQVNEVVLLLFFAFFVIFYLYNFVKYSLIKNIINFRFTKFTLISSVLLTIYLVFQLNFSRFSDSQDLSNLFSIINIDLSKKTFFSNSFIGYPIFTFTLLNFLNQYFIFSFIINIYYIILLILTIVITWQLLNKQPLLFTNFLFFFTYSSLFYIFPKIGNLNFLTSIIYLFYIVSKLIKEESTRIHFSHIFLSFLTTFFLFPPLMLILFLIYFYHSILRNDYFLSFFSIISFTLIIIILLIFLFFFKLDWYIFQLFYVYLNVSVDSINNFSFSKLYFLVSDFSFIIQVLDLPKSFIMTINLITLLLTLIFIYNLRSKTIFFHLFIFIFLIIIPIEFFAYVSSGLPYRFNAILGLFLFMFYGYYFSEMRHRYERI